jgi:hypothetical protein
MNTHMSKKDRNTVAPYKVARTAIDTGGTGVLQKNVLSVCSGSPNLLNPNSPIQSRPNHRPSRPPSNERSDPSAPSASGLLPLLGDSDLPCLRRTEAQRDTAIQDPLDETEVLVEHPQHDNGRETEDKLSVRVDVPGAEDDAVADVCIPEEGVSKERRYTV